MGRCEEPERDPGAPLVMSGSTQRSLTSHALQDAISKLTMENAVLPTQRGRGNSVSQPPAYGRQGSPQAPRKQYTIIEVDQNMSPTKQAPGTMYAPNCCLAIIFDSRIRRAHGVSPKEVQQQQAEAPDFKMFDVVVTGPAEEEAPEDPEMVKFQNMLSDYLKCELN